MNTTRAWPAAPSWLLRQDRERQVLLLLAARTRRTTRGPKTRARSRSKAFFLGTLGHWIVVVSEEKFRYDDIAMSTVDVPRLEIIRPD